MAAKPQVAIHAPELVALADLRPHPRNYRGHPDEQVDQLASSLQEHGLYRNVVVARDGTILAGHGIVQAAEREGIDRLPVIRLDLDPNEPRALKVLTGDNELSRIAEIDDRALSELLREIMETDVSGLIGTGYDEAMLANLIYVTRPSSEIESQDAAAAWVGMPGYENPERYVLSLFCETAEERDALVEKLGLILHKREGVWSSWWPPREREDRNSLMVEG